MLRSLNATWASMYSAAPPSSATAGTSSQRIVDVDQVRLMPTAISAIPATIGKCR